MFKKFILGLGLLGIVSSANASCSYSYSRYASSGVVNNVTPGVTFNSAIRPHTGNGSDTAKLFFDKDCILYYQETDRSYGKTQYDWYTNIIAIPPSMEINKQSCNESDGCSVSWYIRNTSTAASTSNPEVDALKAKVQALESKVYSCVQ